MIEIKNFSKRYGDFLAVDKLDLTIGAGEIFGFIGPNGAGKSTTIRFLATLLSPTYGDALVAGASVVSDPMGVRRRIGYMPDNFGVYDGMRVWEFLDFFAVAYEVPKSQRKGVINQVLEMVDLTHKRTELVHGLSRGMKQRLCLAKTLVHEPPVLILDEPTSGLDPRARMEVKALLKELRKMNKTILISSHILSELADCCTSIGVIERGKLLLSGPIQEVYQRIRRERTLLLKVLSARDLALMVVRKCADVRNVVEQPDGQIEVELAGDDEASAKLLEELLRQGVRLAAFSEREPTLEDVFMSVTQGIVT